MAPSPSDAPSTSATPRRSGILRTTWSDLNSTSAGVGKRIAAISALATVAGILEGFVLVAVVRAALEATGGSDASVNVAVGPISTDATTILLLALGAALALAALNALTSYLSASLSAQVLAASRNKMLDRFLDATWDRKSLEREGSLQDGVSNLALHTSTLTLFLAQSIAAAVGLVCLLAFAVAVDAVIALFVAVVGAVLALILRPIAQRTRALATQFTETNSDLGEEVARVASMAMELQVFGASELAKRQLRESGNIVAGNLRMTRFMGKFGGSFYKDLAIASLAFSVLALFAVGDGTTGSLAAVVLLMVRALSYATQLQSGLQQINQQSPNLTEIRARIARLSRSEYEFGQERAKPLELLEVRGIEYTYPTGATPTISGISLTIESGEIVGIVGPSGGGKSTLLQVLLRLRLPTSGSIHWNGLPYDSIAPDDWSARVAFVPQQPTLIEGSVSENIRFFRSAPDDRVQESARLAHVSSEIEALPSGFDHQLGPRGFGLSGGQAQRVAIARAMLAQPSLLILDEPTSALDESNEDSFVEVLRDLSQRCAIVLVSHRPASLRACTKTYTMVDGSLTRTPERN